MSLHALEQEERQADIGTTGYVLSRNLDPKKYNVLLVSPRSYFVFTPLLNDTAVGTLEFRNALESVRKRNSNVNFIQGWADDVNFADKIVSVEPSVLDPNVGHAMTGPRELNSKQLEELAPHTLYEKDYTQRLLKEGKLQLGGTGEADVPTFPIKYDKLVIAVGAYSQTFGTPGVKENALFLKDVGDARKIRRRVLELFELANLPIVTDQVREWLLHIAVVGGGPTGMEFAASVSDLVHQDMGRLYPNLVKFVKVTLYDVAPKVLPMFEAELADYAVRQYARQNVTIKTSHHVEELRRGFPDDKEARSNQTQQLKGRVYTIRTKEEGDVGIGMCVWSTGNMNNPFVQKALNHVRRYPTNSARIIHGTVPDPMVKQWMIQRDPRSGVMMVDDHFRVQLQTTTDNATDSQSSDPATSSVQAKAIMNDVFAIGDNCKLLSGPLPATAQVANQQAKFLARGLNSSQDTDSYSASPGFQFKNMGVMAYIGGAKAVLQGPTVTRGEGGKATGLNFRGWIAYLMWRGAYLTMTLSWRNKFLIPIQWLAVKVFGRDISRF